MLQAFYDAMDPIAFTIGPLTVRWYGIAYILGFVLGILLIYRIAKRWKIGMTSEHALTLLLCIMVGAILGARLGYVIFYGDGYYWTHPAKILAFNEGGMSFHGGLIGMFIGGLIAARVTKIKFGTLADLVATAAPIGLFFGRVANFINGELWGSVTTMPWGVVFQNAGSLPRHPSQLYEALLEGMVILVVLLILTRREPPLYRGCYFGIFLVLYGIFRILIEFVRQPDVQLGYLAGDWLTMGMLLSIPMLIAGVAFFVYGYRKRLPQSVQAR